MSSPAPTPAPAGFLANRLDAVAHARAYCESAYPRARTKLPRWLHQHVRWTFLAVFAGPSLPAWFRLLQTPGMAEFLPNNPRLALKPMRVYGATNWNQERRLKTLLDTYNLILSKGGAARQALLTPEPDGVVLATVPLGKEEGGEGGALEVCLGLESCLRKEGELTLFIRRIAGPKTGREQHIMSLAFSLAKQADGALVAYIGCVQGQNQNAEISGTEIMRMLTKAMHGLRPKAFMVFLAQEVARALGAKAVRGVGSRLQAHNQKHLVHLPFLHEHTFDYDGLWLEEDGVKIESGPDQGWFELPAQMRKKTHEEIKPQKRSQYKKRYAMQDAVAAEVAKAMA